MELTHKLLRRVRRNKSHEFQCPRKPHMLPSGEDCEGYVEGWRNIPTPSQITAAPRGSGEPEAICVFPGKLEPKRDAVVRYRLVLERGQVLLTHLVPHGGT